MRRATFAEATCTPPSSSSPASSPQILILAPINQRGRRGKFSPRISKKSISSLLSWWWRHAACSIPPEKKNNTQGGGGGRGGREGDATPTFSRSPSGARLWKQFLARHAWIKVDKLVKIGQLVCSFIFGDLQLAFKYSVVSVRFLWLSFR